MRTDERSYKNFLAWDEADRKSKLHNDMCLYLTQQEKVDKLVALAGVKGCQPPTRAELSSPIIITKYWGRERRPHNDIMGFLDLKISCRKDDCDHDTGEDIIIEVKSGKNKITDFIQQLNAYVQWLFEANGFNHRRKIKPILITSYGLNKFEKSILAGEKIRTARVYPADIEKFNREVNC